MKNKRKITSKPDKRHWLEVGQEVLGELRLTAGSGTAFKQLDLELCAARYGKSSHAIRKIVDATAWIADTYPLLLKNPPHRFPLTQALQLRAIHRLNHRRAESVASDVFEGKTRGQDLSDILNKLQKGYGTRPMNERTSSLGVHRLVAAAFEKHVMELMGSVISAEGLIGKIEVSNGREVLPRCDLLVKQDDERRIAVEAKNISPREPITRLLILLGNCALWQSQELDTWLFIPKEATSRVEKLHTMAEECRLAPMKIFVVDGDSATRWKPKLKGPSE